MNLLAFDTSSTACSVALLLDDEISAQHDIVPLQQAKLILPMLYELLEKNKIKLNQIDAIGFGRGPGSFTGVRIAASLAQGLGFALNCPLIPVSSLAALAQAAYEDLGWKKCLAVVDARINEVYCGAYAADPGGLVRLVGAEAVLPPSLVPSPPEKDWYGVGNGWEIYSADIPYQPLSCDTTRLPMAKAILSLAKESYLRREWVDAKEALPVYLRDEVAKKMR